MIATGLKGWIFPSSPEVGETAKAAFPPEITEPGFLQEWKAEAQDVAAASVTYEKQGGLLVGKFGKANDYQNFGF